VRALEGILEGDLLSWIKAGPLSMLQAAAPSIPSALERAEALAAVPGKWEGL